MIAFSLKSTASIISPNDTQTSPLPSPDGEGVNGMGDTTRLDSVFLSREGARRALQTHADMVYYRELSAKLGIDFEFLTVENKFLRRRLFGRTLVATVLGGVVVYMALRR
jgi:hypothetical protein